MEKVEVSKEQFMAVATSVGAELLVMTSGWADPEDHGDLMCAVRMAIKRSGRRFNLDMSDYVADLATEEEE